MKKLLEEQLKELKKHFKEDIAVKLISKKNKFKIVGVITESEAHVLEEEYVDNKTIKKMKENLIETKNYIG